MRTFALMIALAMWHPLAAGAQDLPWEVPPTGSVVEKEIRFENDGVELYGVLHTLEEVREGPALVAIHGSGTPEHDSWLFEHLVEALPALGVSVFVYDRRGTGESGGELATATFQDLADDALAAAGAIAATEQVSRDAVGFWGQSQGVSETGWRQIMDYDPVVALERLGAREVPTWIVYGGADPVVPVALSLEVLEDRFGGSGDWLDVTVIEDADHILMFPDDPDFMNPEIDEADLGPESARYFVTMGAWLQSNVGIR